MATIALYANKINQMPELIKDIKQSVIDYKSELSALKSKTLTINSSACDLDDVISSIQSSTQTQEDKVTSLDTFIQGCEEFITDVQRIDEDVADIIRQRKDDFYEAYYYLKPECEKTLLEKTGDWCKRAWNSGAITQFICCVFEVVCAAAILVAVIATGGTLAIFLASVGAILVTLHAAGGIKESWNKASGNGSHNFVRDNLFGGNQRLYDALPLMGFGLLLGGAGLGGATIGGTTFLVVVLD